MIIRFPPNADLRGRMPMASKLRWWERIFSKPKRTNVAQLRIRRAMRERP